MIRVIHSVSVMNRAGQETFLMNVYRRINREEIQFDFQCSDKGEGDYDSEIKAAGGKILYLGENRIKIPYLKYFGDILLQYRFFKQYPVYDVFHIHTYHAFNAWLSIIGAKMAGMQNIILHSHNSQGMHPRLHKIFRALLSVMKIERYACAEEAAEWMFGKKCIQKNRVHIVKNGIVPENFIFSALDRDKKRKELNIEGKIAVGHVGRFAKQKNHEFLIDIFAEFLQLEEEAILLLIGTGELEPYIRGKVCELGLQNRVKFLGVREDIKELLWAMDIFVLPSLYEGLSVAAVEAQASGVPCIFSDGITEECKIAKNVVFVPLKASSRFWAEQIAKYSRSGHINSELSINQAGYNIDETVKFLEKNYAYITKNKKVPK